MVFAVGFWLHKISILVSYILSTTETQEEATYAIYNWPGEANEFVSPLSIIKNPK